MRSTVTRALLVIAVLGAVVCAAAPWLTTPGGAPASAMSETRMEEWIRAGPGGLWLLWGPRAVAVLLGLLFLVQEALRADRIRGGLLAAPDGLGPTSVMTLTGALAYGVVFPFVVQVVGVAWWAGRGGESAPTEVPLAVGVAIVMAGFLPPALLTALRRQRLGRDRIPRVRSAVAEGLRFGCIALLLVLPVTLLWALALHARGIPLEVQDTVQRFAEPRGAEDPWLITVFGAFVAPFTEEAVFRGLLYPSLRGRIAGGPLGAAVIVSVIFAGIHGSLTAFLPLFVLSLVLCWVIERTNSLLACVVVHALHNAVSLLPLIWRHAAGAAT